MRRALLGLVLALLAGACGYQPAWMQLTPDARGGGLEARLLQVEPDDGPPPNWRHLPAGYHCVTYKVVVRSADGRPHELRAEDFRAPAGSLVEAIGRCPGGDNQMEPVWLYGKRSLTLTILARLGAEEALYIRLG